MDNDKYCLLADIGEKSSEILFGSTLMRQYDYIMDVDNKMIGIARAKCSEDELMIISEYDYLDYGTDFGLNLTK